MSHNGTNLLYLATSTTNIDFQGSTNLRLLAGMVFKIFDSTSADQIQISHNGTDGIFNFTNTTLVNITGANLVAPNYKRGTGTPESAVTGVVGDLFMRTDGGANTTLYVKESGTGNTGWIAK
jgi:hypothetical protein